MPRRPGARIGDVLGIRDRIAEPHPLGVRCRAPSSVREEVVGDAHLVAVGIGAEREQRRVLRLPAEPADAALAGGRDRSTMAARPLMPSPIAIVGILEREDASRRGWPRPGRRRRAGSATRRAMTFASAGITGWQPCVGNREQVEQRLAGRRRRPRTRRLRRGRRRAPRAIGLAPPIAGHVVAHGAARAVERRAEALLGVSTSRKSSSPRRNSSNSRGVRPGSGSPGRHARACADARRRVRQDATSSRRRRHERRQRHRALTCRRRGSPHDDRAAHEVVAGAAHAASTRRCSGPAVPGVKGTSASPVPRFGIATFDVRADDAEAVDGVVALEAELDRLARRQP